MLDFGSNISGVYKNGLYHELDYAATTRFVNSVLSDMNPLLTSRELNELNIVLQKVIGDYSISAQGELYEEIPYTKLNDNLLTRFFEDKRLYGLSETTLRYYEGVLTYFNDWVKKGFDSITTDDIRDYFTFLSEEKKVTPTTLDNERRVFNSFYNYCVVNGLLYTNPVKKIDKIQGQKKIKKPFTNQEIIVMRENFKNLREEAIFELLLSSGMRVGELVGLNKSDLNMTNNTVIVKGKGNKERECFFNDLAKHKIQTYLESRNDDNPALFVNLDKRANRFKINGVERIIRDLGMRSGVNDCHPHKFRRTFATKLLHKGVPMEQIQQYLGHVNIETTQLYAVSNDDELEYNIKRYVN